MTDVLIPERRPAFPLAEQGNYKRTVDGIDLGDLTSAVQHMYGIDGLCAASMLVHYNYNTDGIGLGGGADVDASAEVKVTMEWMSHPAARDLVVAFIAQVSTSRATPGEGTVDLYEISDPDDPVRLDSKTGLLLVAGQHFDRTQVWGGAPQRIYMLPPLRSMDAATTTPDRVMTYEATGGDVWPQGYPQRMELRCAFTGIRPHTIAVFEYPRGTVEGA